MTQPSAAPTAPAPVRAWYGYLAAQALLTAYAAWSCGPAILTFLRVTATRLGEPYALWWLEPLFFRAALAWHEGTPLYGPPSLDYTPGIYNPGMAVAGGTLVSMFGTALPVVRMFSYACLMALATLVAWWSGRVAKSPAVAIAAFALVLSTVTSMGAPVTVTNVDAPATLFCVLACFLLARDAQVTMARIVAAAVCVVLAFAFKQPACFVAAPLAIMLLSQDRKRGLWFLAVTCGLAALMVSALLLASDGWYWTYAFEIPTQTRRVPKPDFMLGIYARHVIAARGLVVGALLLTWLGPKHARWLWLPLSAACTAMGYVGFTKAGGGGNTLLPLCVGGVLLFSLLPWTVTSSELGRYARIAQLIAALLVVHFAAPLASAQLDGFSAHAAGLWRSARPGRPPEQALPPLASFDRRIQQRIRELPKPVFVGARFFGEGFPTNVHQTTLYEGSVRTSVFDMDAIMNEPLASHRYGSMIVWEYAKDTKFRERLERYYERKEQLGFDPLIGVRVSVWFPKP